MNETPKARRAPNKARLQFLAIVAIFVAPVIVAFWLNVAPPETAAPTASHGTLVPGAPTIIHGGLTSLEADAPPAEWTGKWTFLLVNTASACRLRCTEGLHVSRQVRLALGKEMQRIQRILVQTVPLSPREAARLRAFADPESGVTLLQATPAWSRNLESVLPDGSTLDEYVFVVDPEGRFVLYFPLETDPKGLLKDMKRLLRFSKIG